MGGSGRRHHLGDPRFEALLGVSKQAAQRKYGRTVSAA